jgi:hypothetical protein
MHYHREVDCIPACNYEIHTAKSYFNSIKILCNSCLILDQHYGCIKHEQSTIYKHNVSVHHAITSQLV